MTTTRRTGDTEGVDTSNTAGTSEARGKVVMGSITGMPLWVCGPVVPWEKRLRSAGGVRRLACRRAHDKHASAFENVWIVPVSKQRFAAGTAKRCAAEKIEHKLWAFWSLCCRKSVLIVENCLRLIEKWGHVQTGSYFFLAAICSSSAGLFLSFWVCWRRYAASFFSMT